MSRAARGAKVDPYRWRAFLVLGALLLVFALLMVRVGMLQILDSGRGAAFLRHQGDMRTVRNAELPAYRGLITDRRGEPLAVSTPVISLWAHPGRLAQSGRVSELARALSVDPATLQERVARYSGKQFMYLRRHMVPDQAREILALDIEGVRPEREYQRYYPAGEVAAQLVGMTNLDGRGVAGIELAYDNWLAGHSGRKQYIKDLHGEAVRDIGVVEPARPGRSLRMSIDLRLQTAQHRELERAVRTSGAKAGTVVTLDAHSGEVLAAASYPHFNPNNRSGVAMERTRSRALTDVYEPGSTMKPLTLVAALESGLYDVDTIIDTNPGRIRVGRKVLPDPRNYGEISLARVVVKSSQVGVTKVALELGYEPVWNVFQRFGLGAPTATGFPGESPGLLPQRARWRPIEEVTLAFGYGLTATPLQLARAYSVFASGGYLPEVSLLRREEAQPQGRPVISPEIASKVLAVLAEVTADDGTGRRAQVPGYSVGGKTGTVHKVGRGGYLADQYLALFAGIAPIDAPRFVTVVVIDRPQGDNYGGGAAAAPVFARVAQETLRLLGVPPELPLDGEAEEALAVAGVTP